MGMGEPLLNIPAVVAAATYLKEQMGHSGRSITISTVGVPNAMRTLAQYHLTATLAVSIHAPNQQLREQLIPSAKVYPLQVGGGRTRGGFSMQRTVCV
jgi:23S rRNA (adenine2503-C2)-methyltransferase